MKVLELFAGTGSIGSVARSMGHEVFSVDWSELPDISLRKDIETLTLSDIPFVPDMVWASPDCATYSIVAIRVHRDGIIPKTEYAAKCDRVNTHVITLINTMLEINPDLKFYIENPRGMLRKMPFMQRLPIRHTVWYCQYGDRRAKPTDVWTNDAQWVPRAPCRNGNPDCDHEKAPRGAKTGNQGLRGARERGKIPRELCTEVIESASRQTKGA